MVRIYCILSPQLSVDGHLGSFHFLTIVNNAPVHINVQVFVWTCFHFPWVDILGVELLSHRVTLRLTF